MLHKGHLHEYSGKPDDQEALIDFAISNFHDADQQEEEQEQEQDEEQEQEQQDEEEDLTQSELTQQPQPTFHDAMVYLGLLEESA